MSGAQTQGRRATWTPAGPVRRRSDAAGSVSQGPCTEGRFPIGPAADQSQHWRRARTQQVTPEGTMMTSEQPVTQERDATSSISCSDKTQLVGIRDRKLQHLPSWTEGEQMEITNSPPDWGKHCPACFQKLHHRWWSLLRSSGGDEERNWCGEMFQGPLWIRIYRSRRFIHEWVSVPCPAETAPHFVVPDLQCSPGTLPAAAARRCARLSGGTDRGRRPLWGLRAVKELILTLSSEQTHTLCKIFLCKEMTSEEVKPSGK